MPPTAAPFKQPLASAEVEASASVATANTTAIVFIMVPLNSMADATRSHRKQSIAERRSRSIVSCHRVVGEGQIGGRGGVSRPLPREGCHAAFVLFLILRTIPDI